MGPFEGKSVLGSARRKRPSRLQHAVPSGTGRRDFGDHQFRCSWAWGEGMTDDGLAYEFLEVVVACAGCGMGSGCGTHPSLSPHGPSFHHSAKPGIELEEAAIDVSFVLSAFSREVYDWPRFAGVRPDPEVVAGTEAANVRARSCDFCREWLAAAGVHLT